MGPARRDATLAPERCGAGCLCLQIRRAARLVTQLYDQEVRQSGLSMAQFGLLAGLLQMGDSTQSELAERMTLDPTTLTRNVAPLIRRGLVKKVRGGVDRRERRLELTPEGRAQLRAAAEHWRRAQDKVRETLGGTAWRDLHGLLDRVLNESPMGF
jgi:DNA-binding MarR family transcriptional regulator